MEDARETRGLNLKLCFRGIRSYGGPSPLSAEQTNTTGRGGPGRAHGNPTVPSTRPGPTPGRRVQPVGTRSEGDRHFCRLVPPPTLEALVGLVLLSVAAPNISYSADQVLGANSFLHRYDREHLCHLETNTTMTLSSKGPYGFGN
jgi:hypothetical protein